MASIEALASSPLVWVTVGKTEHAAFLLKTGSKGAFVKWASTLETDWVPENQVQYTLTPRRRRPPIEPASCSFSSPNKKRGKIEKVTKPKPDANPSTCAHDELQSNISRTYSHGVENLLLLKSSIRRATTEANIVPNDAILSIRTSCTSATAIEVAHNEVTVKDSTDPAKEPQYISPRSLPIALSLLDPPCLCPSDSSQPSALDVETLDEITAEIKTLRSSSSLISQNGLMDGAALINDNGPALGEEETVTPIDAFATEYSLWNSAYLQNLAEICHTIQNDLRWRVGKSRQPLFRWENGDDLRSITALARRFRPIPRQASNSPCKCEICRKETRSNGAILKAPTTIQPSEGASKASDAPPEDDDQCRALYLYCRLFYRKGPWFRLDDMFAKYYAPKQRLGSALDGNDSAAETEIAAKENFFNRSRGAKIAKSRKCDTVDEILFQKHTDAIQKLLSDVVLLLRNGLIRSFNDEEECGRTVGVGVLNADERLKVLSKLGGGKKRLSKKEHTGVRQDANEIWKQMSTQRSMASTSSAKEVSANSLMPVRRHVRTIVLEKLYQSTIMACTKAEYLPQHVFAKFKEKLQSAVNDLVQKLLSIKGSDGFCFRPREEPTRTLRRAVRLYLCATSGPGEMRSDGYNGWKSLVDTDAQTPFARMIPIPGLHTWNSIVYPGLAYRFGLASFCLMDAFAPLPISQGTLDDTSKRNVFASISHFKAWEVCAELRAHADYLLELNEMLRYEKRRPERTAVHASNNDSVDSLSVLTGSGRQALLVDILSCMSVGSQQKHSLINTMERDIESLSSSFETECESVLGCIAMLAFEVLKLRNETIPDEEYLKLSDRPWLRHLWWEGCLAYILWDVIPIFERRGLYVLSVRFLEVLLFGRVSEKASGPDAFSVPRVDQATRLSPLLLSRRARGKAFDRIIIDLNHILRKRAKEKQVKENMKPPPIDKSWLTEFCDAAVKRVAPLGSIGFAAIRGLAKRLQRPLSKTMESLTCLESEVLGLRYCNSCKETMVAVDHLKYSDWTPTTDLAVANAVPSGEKSVGSRCFFVGHEDENDSAGLSASLNVEELAMEYYKTDRLSASCETTSTRGGWFGYHDEGGHLRALFRLLSAGSVLGMDWGCSVLACSASDKTELATVHLSPYQGAPFDLHVGYELNSSPGRDAAEPSRSFFARRRYRIESFLDSMASLSDQELADLVYDSTMARVEYMQDRRRKDPSLLRDLMQLRTLSFIAAACGGKLLAAAFRCFFFDYRHYSGGLPDCLLLRATYDDSTLGHVDLGHWIGEAFDATKQDAEHLQQALAMLADKDDEFLGCGKVGDSGGHSRSKAKRRQPSSNRLPVKIPSLADVPERLELCCNGRNIKAECMMVEVKSSNDRLDPRQEDWLNILDQHGNARVCKFEDSKKGKNRKPNSRTSTGSA
uniref:Fanconi-associated nuclease n=1 Tax=Phaeodactylum tricornutum TaxID=2850 RepID=A0A8J9S4U3_PHATR